MDEFEKKKNEYYQTKQSYDLHSKITGSSWAIWIVNGS